MKLRTRISIVCLIVAALPGATAGCASSLCFRGPFRRGQCTQRGSSNPCLKVFSDQFEQVSEFTDVEGTARLTDTHRGPPRAVSASGSLLQERYLRLLEATGDNITSETTEALAGEPRDLSEKPRRPWLADGVSFRSH